MSKGARLSIYIETLYNASWPAAPRVCRKCATAVDCAPFFRARRSGPSRVEQSWVASSKSESTRCSRAGTAWRSSSRASARTSRSRSRTGGPDPGSNPALRRVDPERARGQHAERQGRGRDQARLRARRGRLRGDHLRGLRAARRRGARRVRDRQPDAHRRRRPQRCSTRTAAISATTGSVAFQFKRMGVFRLQPRRASTRTISSSYLIDHGLEEMGESTGEKGEPQLVARCAFEDFGTLQKALEDRGITPISAEHEYICLDADRAARRAGDRSARADRQARAGRGRPEGLSHARLSRPGRPPPGPGPARTHARPQRWSNTRMDAARDLFSYRKHWAHRFGPAPFLPMSRAEMDELGWDQLRRRPRDRRCLCRSSELRHGDRGPRARGAGISRRHHRATRLALAPRLHRARPAEPVLRHHRRQHGFDGEPLHGGPPHPQRRRLHAQAAPAAAGPIAASSCMRSACAKRTRTCRSSSAASRLRCAASRTSITGRRRCAARCCSTRRPTCSCTAMPSGRSARSRIDSRAGKPIDEIDDLRGTVFVRKRRCRTAGSRSIRRRSIRRAH